MKRTPLVRKTALRSRKRLNRVSAKQSRLDATLGQARLEAFARSLGRCEAIHLAHDCSGYGEHFHHVLARSAGGKHTGENLLHVCRVAHDAIHGHPTEARQLGYLRSRYPGKIV